MHIDDYDKNYTKFHVKLITAFIHQVAQQPPFCLQDCSQNDQEFLESLQQLNIVGGHEKLIQGQELLCKIVASYPHLMQILPRDLLWFFGGDCLHYMPDDEISLFQSLDEQRQLAKEINAEFNYETARALVFKFH